MILKMALKNLLANKTKTVITLSLIGIGTFLVVLGLGILNFAMQQTKAVCISDFSGDILITGKPEKKDVIVELLGVIKRVSVTFGRPKMPYLSEFQKLTTKLGSMEEILFFTPSVVCGGISFSPVNLDGNWEAKRENRNSYPYAKLLGIEPESYKKIFDTIRIEEGEFPKSNADQFFLLPVKIKEKYEKYYETKLNVGDEIIVDSYSEKPTMKKIKITGLFSYAHPETAIDGISYSSIQTCRLLAGMTMGAKTAVEIPKSVDLSLVDKSEDELFSDDSLFDGSANVSNSKIKKTDFENILGSTELRDSLNMPDADSWNHIAIRLKNSNETKTVTAKLNKWFGDEDLRLQALTWSEAMYSYAVAIKTGRNLFIFALIVLSVVVLIVIMNTLVVSTMERTSEIGTMRAIGANRGFVKKIFYAESFVMSLTGVLFGIILALIVSVIFNSFEVKLNRLLALFFGGYFVQVKISFLAIIGTTFSMLLAGFLANLYPIRLALKISPLEAMSK